MHNPQHLCGRAGTSGARRARAEGEGLSHRGWRVPPGWPEWGALASPLRVPVMQMQTHEGREGVGDGGQAAESPSGRARVCVRGSQVMDVPQRTAATRRGGGGPRTAAAAAARAARKAPQGRGCGLLVAPQCAAVPGRRLSGRALPGRPKDGASFKAPR